jgi:hypothetical protein
MPLASPGVATAPHAPHVFGDTAIEQIYRTAEIAFAKRAKALEGEQRKREGPKRPFLSKG